MDNPRRGTIEAELFGRPVSLCLTLGALAELESCLAGGDLAALSDRLAGGRLTVADLIALLAAGLRGAGETEAAREVASLPLAGGLESYAGIAARLLAAAFGPPADPPPPQHTRVPAGTGRA
jgi:hypothetical protein